MKIHSQLQQQVSETDLHNISLFFIYGRREKQKGKEKQDLSKRQRKDGLKHRYTGRTLNENREAGFDCTAEQTLRVSYKQHKGKLNA